MKKTIVFIGILILGLAATAFALEAPHNATNSIACGDCHSLPVLDDSVCLACHTNDTGGGYSKTSAPKVLTHSSANTSDKYGTWSFQCTDCHNQHENDMRFQYAEESYLVTGIITSTNNNGDGTSTFGYSTLVEQRPGWADFTRWGQKSGNERGLMFYPNFTNFNVSAEVISATAATITVQGWPGSVSVGNEFALTYDQLIDASVITPFGSSTPKFLEPTGPDSFAYNDGLGGDIDSDGNPDDSSATGICQICHSQTQHWRRDGTLAAIGVHSTANGVNCMPCHKHQQGFKAEGCNVCHGFPPVQDMPNDPDLGIEGLITLDASSVPATSSSVTAGAHNVHVNIKGLSCENCHNGGMLQGASQGDDLINIGFTLGGANLGGNYDGQSAVAAGNFPYIGTTPTTVSASNALECSNIYCHGSTLDVAGDMNGGTDITPVWNDPSTGQCGTCHGATAAGPPRRGAHNRHVGLTTDVGHEYECSLCHTDPQVDSSLHVNMKSEINFSSTDPKVSGAQYNGTDTVMDAYGDCSNVYCHSNVQTSPPGGALTYATENWSGTWGNDPPCSRCHEGPADHYSLPLSGNTTGSHTVHATKGIYCATCHANDVSSDPIGCGPCHTANGPHVTHANYSIDVNIVNIYGGSYSGTTAPGDAYSTCSSVYCHSTGQSADGTTTIPYASATPQWGDPASAVCGTCHPTTTGTTLGQINTGSHTKHLNINAICEDCHIGAGDGTAYSSANHVNQLMDVINGYSADGPMGNGYGSCATAPCHSDGQVNFKVTPTWGTSTTPGQECNICHDSLPTSGAHAKHVKTAVTNAVGYGDTSIYTVGDQYDFGCGNCHPTDVATYHINGTIELSLDRNEGGPLKSLNGATEQAGPNDGYDQIEKTSVTCSAAYCHSNGYQDNLVYETTPEWYTGTLTGDLCANCHGNSPNSGGKTGSLSHYNPDAMGTGEIGGHFVGIHYDNIFTNNTGLESAGNTSRSSHGNVGTSTTISCQTCHYGTVTEASNARNIICNSCHTDSGIPAIGDAMAAIYSNSAIHVNGQPDVAFEPVLVRSKAQLRDASIVIPDYSAWDRTASGVSYKANGAFDQSVGALNTANDYDSGAKTCTVACHNDNPVQWGDTGVDCNSCHTGL